MYWLRKRLGCAGKSRLCILQQLSAQIPKHHISAINGIGLSHTELASLSDAHRIKQIAQYFATRANDDGLRQILWWGSALGDIGCAPLSPDRPVILKEAALFNLAVSLFDTVIDEFPKNTPVLSQSLEPMRLKYRLEHPTDNNSALACNDYALNLIVQLFDCSLSSTGKRLSGNTRQIGQLSNLLRMMYESELGICQDPFLAKTLPVVFIGSLANVPEQESMVAFFDDLAQFISFWDDWLDLEQDMRMMVPNAFLSASPSLRGFGMLLYLARASARVLGGGLFHQNIAKTLACSLKTTLDAARQASPHSYEKTIVLCHNLINN